MATPFDTISTVIRDYDGLDPTSTSADIIALRRRYLTKLQIVTDYVAGFRDWEFLQTEDSTLTIAAAANSTALPSNFAELSAHGGLFDEDRKTRYTETPRMFIERCRRESSSGTALRLFGIWGGKLQFPFTATAVVNLVLYYMMRNPVLADDTTALVIPDRYYHRVILPGFLFHTQTGKNDMRPIWSGMFTEGLAQMCAEQNPSKTSGRRMPLAMRRGW